MSFSVCFHDSFFDFSFQQFDYDVSGFGLVLSLLNFLNLQQVHIIHKSMKFLAIISSNIFLQVISSSWIHITQTFFFFISQICGLCSFIFFYKCSKIGYFYSSTYKFMDSFLFHLHAAIKLFQLFYISILLYSFFDDAFFVF